MGGGVHTTHILLRISIPLQSQYVPTTSLVPRQVVYLKTVIASFVAGSAIPSVPVVLFGDMNTMPHQPAYLYVHFGLARVVCRHVCETPFAAAQSIVCIGPRMSSPQSRVWPSRCFCGRWGGVHSMFFLLHFLHSMVVGFFLY